MSFFLLVFQLVLMKIRVLDKNEKYQVVWEVLNALRSLDERFDATINKLELNKKKPEQITSYWGRCRT